MVHRDNRARRRQIAHRKVRVRRLEMSDVPCVCRRRAHDDPCADGAPNRYETGLISGALQGSNGPRRHVVGKEARDRGFQLKSPMHPRFPDGRERPGTLRSAQRPLSSSQGSLRSAQRLAEQCSGLAEKCSGLSSGHAQDMLRARSEAPQTGSGSGRCSALSPSEHF